MQNYIKKLEEGRDLSPEETEAAVDKILSTAQDDEIGAFLLALRAKGEKPEEIAGFVRIIEEGKDVDQRLETLARELKSGIKIAS
jgi:anthranilate phosphoribosyltransferase